jgi:hypothetical protein
MIVTRNNLLDDAMRLNVKSPTTVLLEPEPKLAYRRSARETGYSQSEFLAQLLKLGYEAYLRDPQSLPLSSSAVFESLDFQKEEVSGVT